MLNFDSTPFCGFALYNCLCLLWLPRCCLGIVSGMVCYGLLCSGLALSCRRRHCQCPLQHSPHPLPPLVNPDCRSDCNLISQQLCIYTGFILSEPAAERDRQIERARERGEPASCLSHFAPLPRAVQEPVYAASACAGPLGSLVCCLWFPECPIAFAFVAHLNILSLMRREDTKENFISFQFATFLSLEWTKTFVTNQSS